jgi:hypothetical protein
MKRESARPNLFGLGMFFLARLHRFYGEIIEWGIYWFGAKANFAIKDYLVWK